MDMGQRGDSKPPRALTKTKIRTTSRASTQHSQPPSKETTNTQGQTRAQDETRNIRQLVPTLGQVVWFEHGTELIQASVILVEDTSITLQYKLKEMLAKDTPFFTKQRVKIDITDEGYQMNDTPVKLVFK
jgi:hypothetical protein